MKKLRKHTAGRKRNKETYSCSPSFTYPSLHSPLSSSCSHLTTSPPCPVAVTLEQRPLLSFKCLGFKIDCDLKLDVPKKPKQKTTSGYSGAKKHAGRQGEDRKGVWKEEGWYEGRETSPKDIFLSNFLSHSLIATFSLLLGIFFSPMSFFKFSYFL